MSIREDAEDLEVMHATTLVLVALTQKSFVLCVVKKICVQSFQSNQLLDRHHLL